MRGRPAVIVLASVAIAGCETSALDAVKEMRQMACAGDAPGYLSHVDVKSLQESLVADAKALGEKEAAKMDGVQQVAFRQAFDDSAVERLNSVVRDAVADWETDIKKGPASDICQMSIISGKQYDNSADLQVRTPTGGDRYWRLSRFGKRWVLVRLSASGP